MSKVYWQHHQRISETDVVALLVQLRDIWRAQAEEATRVLEKNDLNEIAELLESQEMISIQVVPTAKS